ncbi:MAG: T9SS type A sorting domain-containing protein [Bacteroidetes bacterium]|nr:T9SS type A sorting domain-containing protein [Bacteroidota bacterium]
MKKPFLFFLLPIITFAQDNIAIERWSVPQEIESIISYFPQGVNTPYISSDGNNLYFEADGQVYFVEKIDSNWSTPNIVQIKGNHYFTIPKISPNNKKLFLIKEENYRKNIFYIEREDKYHSWSEIKSCGEYVNNDSTTIEDYVLQNDSTLLLRIGFGIYYSNYEKTTNNWGPLIKNPDFYYDFYSGNFGGTFINPNYSKAYHTNLFMVWYIIDGHFIDFLKYVLVVRYKDFQNHFGQEYLLNINSDIDSIYSKKIPQMNYFALSPSLTKDGKTLFFAVNYADTTRIYSSKMLVDENGNIVGGIENYDSNIPIKYYLSQNYPNPFNPATTIKYSVPTEAHVTLKIYDILGRDIATLINEQKRPGAYEVNFNASNLPSGVYFYRIETTNFSQIKKLILIK